MHFLQLQGCYDDICTRLYTDAAEELKKPFFKKSFPISKDNRIKFPYRPHNGGFLDHNDKFERALSSLPDSSKKLH
jgi:hypothetical protein